MCIRDRGIFAPTKPIALSIKIPVNVPSISSISPPVKLSPGFMPAKSKAALFAIAAWPSTLLSNTGLSGNNSFSLSLVGNAFTFQSF